MVRFLLTAIGILFSYLLQSAVFPHFSLAGVVPDIIMILVVTAGWTRGRLHGLFTGLFSGFLMDFSIGSIIGYYAVLYMLIGYIAGFSNKIYDKEDYTLPILFIGTGEFIYQNMYYFSSFLLRGRTDYIFYLSRIMLPRTVYTLAAGIFLYKLFHSFYQLSLRIKRK